MMRLWMTLLLVCLWSVSSFAESVQISTGDEQSAVNLTVYNVGNALVKDVRKITIPSGAGELRFMDVASQIIPQTVYVKSLVSAEGFRILEQNYEYDLINRSKLLDKYVGKKVRIMNWNEYQDKKEMVDATLVSNNGGEVYEINGEIFLGHPGISVLPGLPENLIAKPTLTWLFENSGTRDQEIEVSYMTNGVTWNADYVLVIDKEDDGADLAGWVTIDNQSGAVYKEASLKLVAGQPNVVRPQMGGRRKGTGMEVMSMAANDAGFAQETFFEYHLYDLQRKTTIKDKQSKQISLLEASGIPVNKIFVAAQSDFNAYWNSSPATQKIPVSVMICFRNSRDSRLGMPLPAGVVRLYKQDKKGDQQFIGEDRISHTPQDEEVKLKAGEAFDVVVERKQTDFRRTSNRSVESSWEVVLRNHKDENIVVAVEEKIMGHWEVIAHSMDYRKKDAETFVMDVPVPAHGESVVTYTFQLVN